MRLQFVAAKFDKFLKLRGVPCQLDQAACCYTWHFTIFIVAIDIRPESQYLAHFGSIQPILIPDHLDFINKGYSIFASVVVMYLRLVKFIEYQGRKFFPGFIVYPRMVNNLKRLLPELKCCRPSYQANINHNFTFRNNFNSPFLISNSSTFTPFSTFSL